MSEPDAPEEAPPQRPLLRLRDPLPPVVETEAALAATCAAVAAGSGPVAIDAERASGYRYSQRAYLIQLRREGSGTHLVDPIPFASMAPLQEVLDGTEWILHAATQDLPCLADVGLTPSALFDTELAGRLLGYPRVGLATLVETLLGQRLAKEHSAVDWSTRPLPEPWLEYAALDVEVLVELRDVLAEELVETGKDEWARQEFDALRGFRPAVRVDAWRRTSGVHRVRGRRSLGAVRALWELRDEIARERDVTPGRILPDSAIVAAASAMPTDRRTLLRTQGFHGRGASRYATQWVEALLAVGELPEEQLPTRAPRGDGPPLPRTWPEKDPVAARRLAAAKEAVAALSEEHGIPAENLLTPDHLRRVLWAPPATRVPEELAVAVDGLLQGFAARPWQRELMVPLLVDAVLAGDVEPEGTP
ncbi:HRDC domain-containing protein [Nocardioides euryhalodurans]|uniref:Ribonuclease D n=1 Tax=Nocardioides euryhalodurans TaxID=2518370 RepID=A0A4P7GJQ5_9ACTN|nr:ribonuclease D [Nocardioides euryhalodurans]QBR92215.1 ribonuclease D [Nocardioides euryhalodurans]